MADTEAKEIKIVSTPEKKIVDEEKKDVVTKGTPTKEVVEEVDEDSKASENGNVKEATENGSGEEKDVDEKEVESTNGDDTNGDSTDACCIKRKSTGGDVTDDAATKEVASPPKKAKLDDKPAVAVEAETNGDA